MRMGAEPIRAIRADLYGRGDREARLGGMGPPEPCARPCETNLRTHLHLFSCSDWVSTRLKAAAAARRSAECQQWLSALPSHGVGQLINDAAAAAAPGEQPMYGAYP